MTVGELSCIGGSVAFFCWNRLGLPARHLGSAQGPTVVES